MPYYRVSTRRQGESGLGLEAQQSCVINYARTGSHEIIVSYQEIETGKRADRPELAKAWHTRSGRRVSWSSRSLAGLHAMYTFSVG